MKAIWFKEFRLYTSFDRALWCALIWPFILALNPLFLEAGESLSTAMIDAPGFALLFSLCVDYTTYDDYRSGVFELIVQAGLPLREYLTAKLWFYEAVSSAFLLVSLVAGLAIRHARDGDAAFYGVRAERGVGRVGYATGDMPTSAEPGFGVVPYAAGTRPACSPMSPCGISWIRCSP